MTEDMQYDGPPPIDELTGEMVVFVMFGREIIGVVTGYRGNRVLIDAGAGEMEIEMNKIIRVIDVPEYHTTASMI